MTETTIKSGVLLGHCQTLSDLRLVLFWSLGTRHHLTRDTFTLEAFGILSVISVVWTATFTIYIGLRLKYTPAITILLLALKQINVANRPYFPRNVFHHPSTLESLVSG